MCLLRWVEYRQWWTIQYTVNPGQGSRTGGIQKQRRWQGRGQGEIRKRWTTVCCLWMGFMVWETLWRCGKLTLKIRHQLPLLRTGDGGSEQQLRLNSEVAPAGSTALLCLTGRASPICVPNRRSWRWEAWWHSDPIVWSLIFAAAFTGIILILSPWLRSYSQSGQKPVQEHKRGQAKAGEMTNLMVPFKIPTCFSAQWGFWFYSCFWTIMEEQYVFIGVYCTDFLLHSKDLFNSMDICWTPTICLGLYHAPEK